MVYDDIYLTNNIAQTVIDKFEDEATTEVTALKVTDTFFANKLIRCRVYMSLATVQIEDEEMKKKYDIYEKDFDRYLKLAKGESDGAMEKSVVVKSVPLFRG